VFTAQAYQTSQYVVPRGGIFLGKWGSSFAGNSDREINVKSTCLLNTRYYIKETGLQLTIYEFYSWEMVLNVDLDVSFGNM
jgi:hypothetical protein